MFVNGSGQYVLDTTIHKQAQNINKTCALLQIPGGKDFLVQHIHFFCILLLIIWIFKNLHSKAYIQIVTGKI
jgi:hypothetical protein